MITQSKIIQCEPEALLEVLFKHFNVLILFLNYVAHTQRGRLSRKLLIDSAVVPIWLNIGTEYL